MSASNFISSIPFESQNNFYPSLGQFLNLMCALNLRIFIPLQSANNDFPLQPPYRQVSYSIQSANGQDHPFGQLTTPGTSPVKATCNPELTAEGGFCTQTPEETFHSQTMKTGIINF